MYITDSLLFFFAASPHYYFLACVMRCDVASLLVAQHRFLACVMRCRNIASLFVSCCDATPLPCLRHAVAQHRCNTARRLFAILPNHHFILDGSALIWFEGCTNYYLPAMSTALNSTVENGMPGSMRSLCRIMKFRRVNCSDDIKRNVVVAKLLKTLSNRAIMVLGSARKIEVERERRVHMIKVRA